MVTLASRDASAESLKQVGGSVSPSPGKEDHCHFVKYGGLYNHATFAIGGAHRSATPYRTNHESLTVQKPKLKTTLCSLISIGAVGAME